MARHPNVPRFHVGMPEMHSDHWREGGKRGWEMLIFYQFQTLAGGKNYISKNGRLRYDGTTGIATVYPRYTWDRCSVPWLLRGIFKRTEKTLEPGLGHDVGYELGRAGVFDSIPGARTQLDWFFYWNMLLQTVTERKARWMRYGVRTGGGSSFRG